MDWRDSAPPLLPDTAPPRVRPGWYFAPPRATRRRRRRHTEAARSRYHGLTLGLRGRGAYRTRSITFEAHYTLAFDHSDDDNECDPFILCYADARDLAPEYGWSDRERRHQLSGYLLIALPGDLHLNHVVRYLSASPVSEQCANRGMRAA